MGLETGDRPRTVFNLIDEPWLPVRRRSGAVEHIQPWCLNEGLGEDPFVAFAWPRPDFNGAAHELLIGLLSTAATPADDDKWEEWWLEPPAPEVLEQRFSTVSHAFDLDGAGPRFLQDLDPLDGAEDKEIASLLIDTPGAKTLRNNADLFVKRGAAPVLSRSTAAMALFTLNSFAPAGGAGHRTSMRGGGPMTTLVFADHLTRGSTLWGRLWPNVESREQIEARAVETILEDTSERVFPWLIPTRTSNPKAGGRPTTPRRCPSLADLLGHAPPHPAPVPVGARARMWRHGRRGLHRRYGLSDQELRNKLLGGIRTSPDAALSAEGGCRHEASRPSQPRGNQLSAVAGSRRPEQGRPSRARTRRSPLGAVEMA